MMEIIMCIITRLAMKLLHVCYKYYNEDIFYVRGTGKHYPKYMLYTENPNTYQRMENF